MMKLIKENWRKVILFLFTFSVPVFMLYASESCEEGKICNPISGIENITDLIKILLEKVLMIGFPLVALAIIYCGFLFVAARGNSEKITKAKDALLYTIIGAAILLGSWAIAQVISETVTGLS